LIVGKDLWIGRIVALAFLWALGTRQGFDGQPELEEHQVVAIHRFDCGQLAWQVLFIDCPWRALKPGQEIVLI
jgi:hypothetical protein